MQVQAVLIDDRQTALGAIKKGFCSLDMKDHLEDISGLELATLFFGVQYVDTDALKESFAMEDTAGAWQTMAWLKTFVGRLSENSIRIFLARVTNKLTVLKHGQQISVEVAEATDQPSFHPMFNHITVPNCTSYQVFESRMSKALRLSEFVHRTGLQEQQRLTQEEEAQIAAALQREVRQGAYYRCTCGFPYAIGECGGAMEVGRCPECGAAIGGERHQLQAGNQPANFNGHVGAAWPM